MVLALLVYSSSKTGRLRLNLYDCKQGQPTATIVSFVEVKAAQLTLKCRSEIAMAYNGRCSRNKHPFDTVEEDFEKYVGH